MSNSDALAFFDRIFVVNLDRHPDRLEKFAERMDSIGVPRSRWERFRGVDGSKLPIPSWWPHGPGHYGCFLSHLSLLLHITNTTESENVLIFEDDAAFAANFREALPKAMEELPPDWDVLMLGGFHWKKRGDDQVAVHVSDRIVRSVFTVNMHAYAINRESIKKVFEAMTDRIDWIQYGETVVDDGDAERLVVDHLLGSLTQNSLINLYCVDPFLVAQDTSVGTSTGTWKSGEVEFYNDPKIRHLEATPVPAYPETKISFAKAGWGEVRCDGLLGYGEGAVCVNGVPENTTWLSAHAPSRIVLETDRDFWLFGAENGDEDSETGIVARVDGKNVGILRQKESRTYPVKISPGAHFLDFAVSVNRCSHSVWGMIPCDGVDIETAVQGPYAYPTFEILTCGVCPRRCNECNQAMFLGSFSDYNYDTLNANALVEALDRYDTKCNLVFTGGEPANWKHLESVMDIFNQSDKIVSTRVHTSEKKEDSIAKLKRYFDNVYFSVRSDSERILAHPELVPGVTLWNQIRHRRLDVQRSKEINCCCVLNGITASIIGDKFYPCPVAMDLHLRDKWAFLPSISIDDYISGRKYFRPIGTYNECQECVNNLFAKSELVKS